jgi:hypothetical protein
MKYSFIFVLVFSFFISISANTLASGEGITLSTKIENPLGDEVDSLPKLIAKALEIVVKLGVPVIAFFVVYSGFMFIAARGNKDKLTTAKDSMLYTLIGAAIILGAFVISKLIGGTVEQIKSGI